jgi:hypothetical protein
MTASQFFSRVLDHAARNGPVISHSSNAKIPGQSIRDCCHSANSRPHVARFRRGRRSHLRRSLETSLLLRVILLWVPLVVWIAMSRQTIGRFPMRNIVRSTQMEAGLWSPRREWQRGTCAWHIRRYSVNMSDSRIYFHQRPLFWLIPKRIP